MNKAAFWAIIGVLVLTPPALLLLAQWRPVDLEGTDALVRLKFARISAWTCCSIPTLHMVLTIAPQRFLGNFGVYLNVLLLTLAPAMGAAAILLLLSQKGLTRTLPLLACLLSVILSVLGFFAGMAAA